MSFFERASRHPFPALPAAILIAALVVAAAAHGTASAAKVDKVGPLTLPGLDGKQATIDFKDAKVTLVNFWATWCMPCRQEMPQLDELFRRYRSKGLQVVGVAVQSGEPPVVKEFLEKNIPITYTALVGDIDVMERFGEAEIVPTTYLVGSDGAILERHFGVTQDFAEQIESEIVERLGGGAASAAPAPGPATARRAEPVELTRAERTVLAALEKDWSLPEHLSDVDMVMRNLGVAPTEQARIRIGKHILASEDLDPAVARYGAISVVLSKQEKMIVRALLDREIEGAPIPTMQELSALTGARSSEIPSSLEILEALGFVEPASSVTGVGMRVAGGLAGSADPADLASTVVTEEGAKPFAVGSLPRFLGTLVASPPQGRVVIDGLCSHCVSKVQIVMEKGQVSLPTSAALLLGGGSYDALFLSSAHLQQWLRRHPEMKDLPHAELTEFVEALHGTTKVAAASVSPGAWRPVGLRSPEGARAPASARAAGR